MLAAKTLATTLVLYQTADYTIHFYNGNRQYKMIANTLGPLLLTWINLNSAAENAKCWLA